MTVHFNRNKSTLSYPSIKAKALSMYNNYIEDRNERRQKIREPASKQSRYEYYADSGSKSRKPMLVGIAAWFIIYKLVTKGLPMLGVHSVNTLVFMCIFALTIILARIVYRIAEHMKYDPERAQFYRYRASKKQALINSLTEECYSHTSFKKETGFTAEEAGLFGANTREQASTYFEYLVFNVFEELQGITHGGVFLPSPNGSTEIDVIYISNHGVYVIECKNMPGCFGGSQNAESLIYSNNNEAGTIHNPFRQNHGHMLAVQEAINKNLPRVEELAIPVFNVVVVPNGADFSALDITSEDTFILNYSMIKRFVHSNETTAKTKYNQDVLHVLNYAIETSRLRGRIIRQWHIANVNANHG